MAKRKPYELDLTMSAVSLKHFSWKDGVLSTFASDLPCNRNFLHRLYNDACDVGMAIRSHLTNQVERFVLAREETRDGDLLAWYLKPLNPQSRVKEVVIFND